MHCFDCLVSLSKCSWNEHTGSCTCATVRWVVSVHTEGSGVFLLAMGSDNDTKQLRHCISDNTKKDNFKWAESLTKFAKPEGAGHFLLCEDCTAWIKKSIEPSDLDMFLQDKEQWKHYFPLQKIHVHSL